jgi:putative phosphoesterase
MTANQSSKAKVIAVVADTHVPDRVNTLHPQLIPLLDAARPALILHTGDISSPSILDELGMIAPVSAVRGNRDWNFSPQLPMHLEIKIKGVHIVLTHAHGGWGHYFTDKVQNTLHGYHLDRYEKYLTNKYPKAQVFIFGHSHFPENTRRDERLFFNPGSACMGGRPDIPISFGLVEIGMEGRIDAMFLELTGFELKEKRWVALP